MDSNWCCVLDHLAFLQQVCLFDLHVKRKSAILSKARALSSFWLACEGKTFQTLPLLLDLKDGWNKDSVYKFPHPQHHFETHQDERDWSWQRVPELKHVHRFIARVSCWNDSYSSKVFQSPGWISEGGRFLQLLLSLWSPRLSNTNAWKYRCGYWWKQSLMF